MNKLPCEVIKDLLPSYIDKLTSGTTSELIKEHLKNCESCRAAYNSMCVPEAGMDWEEQEKKEIDYLKKNKKRNRKIVAWSIVGALVLAVSVLAVRVFMIGDGNFTNWYPMDLIIEGNMMTFNAVPMDSASAITKLTYEEEDGVVTVKARAVLVGLYKGSRQGEYIAKEPIREVRIGNRTIWADGATVSPLASDLFAARHDYIGDMPANSRLADAMSLGAFLGPYTNELETAKEPYGWKIDLAMAIPETSLAQKEQDMEAFGLVMIALTGNLDHVTFTYRTAAGEQRSLQVTQEDADALFGEDVKICGSDIRALDRFLEKVGMNRDFAMMEPVDGEAQDDVWVKIVNMSESDLKGIGVSCYKDGQKMSDGYGMNADESPIGFGKDFWVSAGKMDFGGSWDENATLELAFTLHTADGKEYELPDRIRIPALPGTARTYRLVGSPAEGFQLVQ
ncbi:MAG: DUF4825 domain-containing protein [Lachnospiraceae bacterium]|nr:DUF4825 domain-containing protein [Lachnospiraceae bacterium]